MKFWYSPPWLLKTLFSDFIWKTSNDKVLITFDDGPVPNTTEMILEYLKNQNMKAMFFCVGENIAKYPKLARKIVDDGHFVGCHNFYHSKINEISEKEFADELMKFRELCKQNNIEFSYFRPPHGRFKLNTARILAEYNLQNVMWSLLTWDYKNDLNIVKFAINKYLQKDSIVVFHDSKKSEKIVIDSLDFLLKKVNERGFTIGEPSECLR